jgi:hypothetical protein
MARCSPHATSGRVGTSRSGFGFSFRATNWPAGRAQPAGVAPPSGGRLLEREDGPKRGAGQRGSDSAQVSGPVGNSNEGQAEVFNSALPCSAENRDALSQDSGDTIFRCSLLNITRDRSDPNQESERGNFHKTATQPRALDPCERVVNSGSTHLARATAAESGEASGGDRGEQGRQRQRSAARGASSQSRRLQRAAGSKRPMLQADKQSLQASTTTCAPACCYCRTAS